MYFVLEAQFLHFKSYADNLKLIETLEKGICYGIW